MFSDTHVTIHILTGTGMIPESIFTDLTEGTICGLPVRVVKVGRKPLPVGPSIGMVVALPAKILPELGDCDISVLRRAVADFFEINNDACNFSILMSRKSATGLVEMTISSSDMAAAASGAFFDALGGRAGSEISDLQVPGRSDWAVYVNISTQEGAVRDVTAFDIVTKDFYVLNRDTQDWEKQANPEASPIPDTIS